MGDSVKYLHTLYSMHRLMICVSTWFFFLRSIPRVDLRLWRGPYVSGAMGGICTSMYRQRKKLCKPPLKNQPPHFLPWSKPYTFTPPNLHPQLSMTALYMTALYMKPISRLRMITTDLLGLPSLLRSPRRYFVPLCPSFLFAPHPIVSTMGRWLGLLRTAKAPAPTQSSTASVCLLCFEGWGLAAGFAAGPFVVCFWRLEVSPEPYHIPLRSRKGPHTQTNYCRISVCSR